MQYLFDESGRRYLDAFAGIVTVSVGHCHPHVVDAIVRQTKLLQHTTTIYLNHAIGDFAEALAEKMPGNLKVLLSPPLFGPHPYLCFSLLNAHYGKSSRLLFFFSIGHLLYNLNETLMSKS